MNIALGLLVVAVFVATFLLAVRDLTQPSPWPAMNWLQWYQWAVDGGRNVRRAIGVVFGGLAAAAVFLFLTWIVVSPARGMEAGDLGMVAQGCADQKSAEALVTMFVNGDDEAATQYFNDPRIPCGEAAQPIPAVALGIVSTLFNEKLVCDIYEVGMVGSRDTMFTWRCREQEPTLEH